MVEHFEEQPTAFSHDSIDTSAGARSPRPLEAQQHADVAAGFRSGRKLPSQDAADRGGAGTLELTEPGSTDPRMRGWLPDAAQGVDGRRSRCVTAEPQEVAGEVGRWSWSGRVSLPTP